MRGPKPNIEDLSDEDWLAIIKDGKSHRYNYSNQYYWQCMSELERARTDDKQKGNISGGN